MPGQVNPGHDVQVPRRLAWNTAPISRRAPIVDNGRIPPQVQYLASTVMIFVFARVGLGVFFLFFRHFVGRNHRDGGMMNDASVPGKHFRGLHPFIFTEGRGDIKVFVVVLTAARHQKLGNGQHHVRLNVPAFREDRSRR